MDFHAELFYCSPAHATRVSCRELPHPTAYPTRKFYEYAQSGPRNRRNRHSARINKSEEKRQPDWEYKILLLFQKSSSRAACLEPLGPVLTPHLTISPNFRSLCPAGVFRWEWHFLQSGCDLHTCRTDTDRWRTYFCFCVCRVGLNTPPCVCMCPFIYGQSPVLFSARSRYFMCRSDPRALHLCCCVNTELHRWCSHSPKSFLLDGWLKNNQLLACLCTVTFSEDVRTPNQHVPTAQNMAPE